MDWELDIDEIERFANEARATNREDISILLVVRKLIQRIRELERSAK